MNIKRLIQQVGLAGATVALLATQANAADFTSHKVYPGDSIPSQTSVSYTHTFTTASASVAKCIKIVYSTSATTAATPTGFTAASATLTSTTVPGTWVLGTATANTVTITNTTGTAIGSGRNVILAGITNGSTAETSYFAQLYSYTDTGCTTLADSGVAKFIYENGQAVTATVDPTLTFTLAGVASGQTVNGATTNETSTAGTIPFSATSAVTTSTNKVLAHDLTVSTNAQNGYTIYTRYTGTLQNGGAQAITNHTGTNAAPTAFSAAGTESFGYTTNDITLGTGTANRFNSNLWAAFSTTDSEVAYNATSANAQTTRVGYQLGISGTTAAGTYTTTVIYTAVPTY